MSVRITKADVLVAEAIPGLIAETRLHFGEQSLIGWWAVDLDRALTPEHHGAWTRIIKARRRKT